MPKHPVETYNLMGVINIDVALAWALIESNPEREPDGVVDVQAQGRGEFGPVEPESEPELAEGELQPIPLAFHRIDKEYALNNPDINTSIPLLCADLGEYGTPMIDGRHRLYKAYAAGVEAMPVYRLTRVETYCLITKGRELIFHPDAQSRNNSRIDEIREMKNKLKALKRKVVEEVRA